MKPTQKIDLILADYLAKGAVGVSLAYAIDGSPINAIAAGIADRRDLSPVGTGRLFKIGSCTKTFVVAALLKLLEDKRIDLATPISRWFPDVPGSDGIAVHQLVNHRNGLPEFEYGISMDYGRQWKPEELVDLAFKVGRQEQPGGPAVYNNTGYALAGILIENLSGKQLGAYVREVILEPLGLQHTWSPATEPFPENELVRGYYHRPPPDSSTPVGKTVGEIASGGEMWRMEGVLPFSNDLQDSTETFPNSGAFALGDMVSTPTDMVTFMRSLFAGDVLPIASLSQMVEDRAPVAFPGTRMREAGMGVFASDYGNRTFFGHQGSIPGYVCTMQHDPESKVTIAITTNVGSGRRLSFQASGLHPVVDAVIGAVDEGT